MIRNDKDVRCLLASVVGRQIQTVVVSGPMGAGKTHLVKECLRQFKLPYIHIPSYVSDEEIWGSLDFEQSIRHGRAVNSFGLVGREERIWYVEDWTYLEQGVQQSILRAIKQEEKLLITTVMHGADVSNSFWEDVDVHVYIENPTHTVRKQVMVSKAYSRHSFFKEKSVETFSDLNTFNLQTKEALFKSVEISNSLLDLIGHYVVDGCVKGNRTESVLVGLSRSFATLDGQSFVSPKHIEEAAIYVLPHKMNVTSPPKDEIHHSTSLNNEIDTTLSSQDSIRNDNSDGTSRDVDVSDTNVSDKDVSNKNTNNKKSNDKNIGTVNPSYTNFRSHKNASRQSKTHSALNDCKEDSNTNTDINIDTGADNNASTNASTNNSLNLNENKHSTEIAPQINGEFFLSLLRKMERHKSSVIPRNTRRMASGKRYGVVVHQRYGHSIRTVKDENARHDISLSATLKEAAPYQTMRKKRRKGVKILVEKRDFHRKIRASKAGGRFLFIVDGSSSMASYSRLVAAREAMYRLLLDAYQKRDQVGLIVFRGEKAELVVPFTNSIDRVRKALGKVSTGGKTPLHKGLELGCTVLRKAMQGLDTFISHAVIITDGRCTGGDVERGKKEALFWAEQLRTVAHYITVLDTEKKRVRLGLCKSIAKAAEGFYCDMKDIQSDTILSAIKDTRKV